MISESIFHVRYYAQGNVSQDQYIQVLKKNILNYLFTIPFTQFIRHDTLGFEYLDQSKNFAPQVRS